MLDVFFRQGMFYPIQLASDADARLNAECNPGTIRVERFDGTIIWPNVVRATPWGEPETVSGIPVTVSPAKGKATP